MDSGSIQRCQDAGARLILMERGEYRPGEVALKSNVTLELAAGATLFSQISIVNAVNVTILGDDRATSRIRGTLTVRNSHGIRLRNFDQEGSNGQGYFSSSHIRITGVSIRQTPQRHGSGSAIWFNDCKDVWVTDSEFSSNDDVFALKHSGENIHLRHTTLRGKLAAAFKIGTETEGVFHNISMTDCTIPESGRGAISIESVDGARIDGVYIANIRMNDVAAPLFIRLGNRARYGQGPGSIRNIRIDNIRAAGVARDEGIGSAIAGLPGYPIENISIRHFEVTYRGGGSVADALRSIDEMPAAYPEFDMFGRLPAYGLFIRHARNVSLRDVSLRYSQPDARPPVMTSDVEGFAMTRLRAMSQPGTATHLTANGAPLKAQSGEAAHAGSVWIDSNGNGKLDPGERAFASIGQALAAAQAGDCILLDDGLYEIPLSELPLRVRAAGVQVRSAHGARGATIEVRGADYNQGANHSLFYVTADDVTIEGLTLRGGVWDVLVEGAAATVIRNCFFDGSKSHSIGLERARGTQVIANRFRGSGTASIDMNASRDCVIEGNLFYEDTAGIQTAGSNRNRFAHNDFHAPAWFGICLTNSDGNILEGNVVDGGRLSGLQLRGSNRNRVTGNALTNNKTEGLLIDGESQDNTIRENDIHGNKGPGIANESSAPVDAASNWWGSTAGAHDAVAGQVRYRPWLLQAPAGLHPNGSQN